MNAVQKDSILPDDVPCSNVLDARRAYKSVRSSEIYRKEPSMTAVADPALRHKCYSVFPFLPLFLFSRPFPSSPNPYLIFNTYPPTRTNLAKSCNILYGFGRSPREKNFDVCSKIMQCILQQNFAFKPLCFHVTLIFDSAELLPKSVTKILDALFWPTALAVPGKWPKLSRSRCPAVAGYATVRLIAWLS